MATFRYWTKGENAALTAAFGGQSALDAHIAMRVCEYMNYLASGQVTATAPPNRTTLRAVAATGRSRVQVLTRVEQIVRDVLGMSVAGHLRGPRRDKLRQYAIAGLRTLDEIRAADKGGQLTVPGIDAPKAAAPAPKPRTLDDIASELRMAREEATRLSVAAAHAEKRMSDLRAELTRAVEEV